MGLAEEYLRQCEALHIKKPNKDIVRHFSEVEAFEDLELLDLTTNYVGQRGMLAVMEVVARCPNLSTLVCGHQNAELSSDNTEGVEKIMHVVRTHPSLTSISFTGNPVTAFGAQRLLALARENPQLLQLQIDDPLVDTAILQRINEELEKNMERAIQADEVHTKYAANLTLSVPDSSAEHQPLSSRRRTGVSAEVMQCHSIETYCPLTVPKSEGVQAQLTTILLKNPLFSHLLPEELQRFVQVMFCTRWVGGQHIIEFGTPGENFYVLTKGQVEIVKEGQVVCVKTESQVFGELELMYDTLACATVRAVGEVEAWAISRNDYQHLMIGEMMTRRKQFVDFLSRIPFTGHLNMDEKLQIADALEMKAFDDGEQVIRQGDDCATMYIVQDGCAVISRVTEDGDVVDLGPRTVGDYFGEFEFLFNVPRFCSVYAKGPLRTLSLKKKDFEFSMGPVMDLLKRNTEVYRFYVADDGRPADRTQSSIDAA
eukprot:EG_transcript_8206